MLFWVVGFILGCVLYFGLCVLFWVCALFLVRKHTLFKKNTIMTWLVTNSHGYAGLTSTISEVIATSEGSQALITVSVSTGMLVEGVKLCNIVAELEAEGGVITYTVPKMNRKPWGKHQYLLVPVWLKGSLGVVNYTIFTGVRYEC